MAKKIRETAHYKISKKLTLVRPRRAVFVTPYIAKDTCGWYPEIDEIRITDDPLLRCGAADCNKQELMVNSSIKEITKSIPKQAQEFTCNNRTEAFTLISHSLSRTDSFMSNMLSIDGFAAALDTTISICPYFCKIDKRTIFFSKTYTKKGLFKQLPGRSFRWDPFAAEGLRRGKQPPKLRSLSIWAYRPPHLHSSVIQERGEENIMLWVKKLTQNVWTWVGWVSNFDLLSRWHDNGGALEAEPLSDGEPDSLRRRRHDRDFALQSIHLLSIFYFNQNFSLDLRFSPFFWQILEFVFIKKARTVPRFCHFDAADIDIGV